MLRPAYNTEPPLLPSHWQALPYGDWLKERVEAQLDEWWPKLFGYHLLKLGALADTLPSSLCPIPHQFSLAQNGAGVQAELSKLPLTSSSIDAVVAPFCLEFQQDPHVMLRELDRVLISGGHLLLLGFSLSSPMALGYLWPSKRKHLPWSGRLFTQARVMDWLSVLGYRVISQESLTHHPLLWAPNKFPMTQCWLTDHLPSFGSVYLIVARKLESPLTPVRKRRSIRRPLVGQPARELARVSHHRKRRR